MALTAAEKRKKMQEIKKNLADKRAKNKEKSPRAKLVEKNRNKTKVAYQEKLAKKKTAVSGTKVNTNKGKNEILDFINFNLERKIDREFKHNTNLKSRKESIINKIKKWF